ncbi:hypothetical protein RAA17_09245 [Komagataeibacter rhaeticus]|nr:hypothetical protein [Komagataeibacter rhaeticus]
MADPMLPCKSGNPAMPKRIKEQDISFVMLPKHTLKQLYEGLGCCTLHAGTADKNGKGTTGMPGWCPECATHPPGYDFMAQPGNFSSVPTQRERPDGTARRTGFVSRNGGNETGYGRPIHVPLNIWDVS